MMLCQRCTNTIIYFIVPLVNHFLVVLPHQMATDMSLEESEDLGEALISQVLKNTQDTSPEEDFGVSNLEHVVI